MVAACFVLLLNSTTLPSGVHSFLFVYDLHSLVPSTNVSACCGHSTVIVTPPSALPRHTSRPKMKFQLEEVTVFFPYEYIYPEQYLYMQELKRALDAPGHCLLEVRAGAIPAFLHNATHFIMFACALAGRTSAGTAAGRQNSFQTAYH